MHSPTEKITHANVFVIPVVEDWLKREIAHWVHHRSWYVLSCLWDGAYKITIAVNWKEQQASSFTI